MRVCKYYNIQPRFTEVFIKLKIRPLKWVENGGFATVVFGSSMAKLLRWRISLWKTWIIRAQKGENPKIVKAVGWRTESSNNFGNLPFSEYGDLKGWQFTSNSIKFVIVNWWVENQSARNLTNLQSGNRQRKVHSPASCYDAWYPLHECTSICCSVPPNRSGRACM